MAFRGRLSELEPAEVFQLLALTGKTGKLVLGHGDRQGVVLFRLGKVVFAASDSLRSAFCASLAAGRVRPDSRLVEAVGRRLPGAVTDSGTFLVEYREGRVGALEELIREQIEATVRELVTWRDGTFCFEPVDVPETEAIALDAGWFALAAGVESDELVLAALTKLDEGERARWRHEVNAAAAAPAPPAEASRSDISAAFEVLVDQRTGEVSWVPVEPAALEPSRALDGLRRLVDETHELHGMDPELTAEVALLILRYAAQVVSRGVLFAVRGDSIQGIGQFGLRFADADERVRQLRLPADEESTFTPVLATGQPFRGRPARSLWGAYLLDQLGAAAAVEVVLVPLVVDGEVVAVLYGDNLPRSSQVGAVDGLEILLHEVGLGVEKARLERRLEALEVGTST